MQFRLQEYEGSRFVTVDISLSDNSLTLNYNLSGLNNVVWQDPSDVPCRKDELWRHTCLELFIGEPGNKRYAELNLSPSGDWQSYHFDDYRDGMTLSNELLVERIAADAESKQLSAMVRMNIDIDPLLLGPAAVIEFTDGNLHYFALEHGKQPDFHQRAFYIQTPRNHL